MPKNHYSFNTFYKKTRLTRPSRLYGYGYQTKNKTRYFKNKWQKNSFLANNTNNTQNTNRPYYSDLEPLAPTKTPINNQTSPETNYKPYYKHYFNKFASTTFNNLDNIEPNNRLKKINLDVLKNLNDLNYPITDLELELFKTNLHNGIYSNFLDKYKNAIANYELLKNSNTVQYKINKRFLQRNTPFNNPENTLLNGFAVSKRLLEAKNKAIYGIDTRIELDELAYSKNDKEFFNPGLDSQWYYSYTTKKWYRKKWAVRPDAINPQIAKYYPLWFKDLLYYNIDQSNPPNLDPEALTPEQKSFYLRHNYYNEDDYSPYAKTRNDNLALFNGDVSLICMNNYLTSLKDGIIKQENNVLKEELKNEFLKQTSKTDPIALYPSNLQLPRKNETLPDKVFNSSNINQSTQNYAFYNPNYDIAKDPRVIHIDFGQLYGGMAKPSYSQLKTPKEKYEYAIRQGWIEPAVAKSKEDNNTNNNNNKDYKQNFVNKPYWSNKK